MEITAQNHNYNVDPATLPGDVEQTHTNLNDQTLAGLKHKTDPMFSVAVPSRRRVRGRMTRIICSGIFRRMMEEWKK